MPLDPSIILAGLRNQGGDEILQGMQIGQQMGARRQQMQAQQMEMDEAQRQQMSQQAVDSALSHYAGQGGQIDREGVARYLGLRGEGRALQGLQQGWSKSDIDNAYKQAQTSREIAQMGKDKAESTYKQIESGLKTAQFVGMVANGTLRTFKSGDVATAQRAWELGLEQAARQGMSIDGIPRNFDPSLAQTLSDWSVSTEKRLEAELAAEKEANLGKRHAESLAVTKRGQDLVSNRAGEANRVAAQGNIIKGETDIRKEFADLPEVKNYKAAYPSFAAIQKASEGNTPQSDINLIYGIAKLYDPTSVVREGEYNTIANSQAIPEQIKGWAQRVAGGGRLTAETKRQLMAEASNRIATYEGEYRKAQGAYSGIAQQRGLSPESIFTPIGDVGQRGESKKKEGGTGNHVKPGTTYTDPDDGTVYVSIGGPRNDPKTWKKR